MKAATTPITVGVLSRAHVHADGYLSLLASMPDVDVLVADPDGPDGADRRANSLPVAVTCLDNLSELLARGPDAVVITSETARHRELIELVAPTGAAILCEKPLATTAEDARAIARLVRAREIPFMIAYPVRFMAVSRELIARARAGQLGALVAIRGANNGRLPTARPWFVEPALSGGGALFDHVVHVADLADALTGARAATVSAVTNRILSAGSSPSAETGGLVLITYDTGVVAAIDCSWSLPATAPSWGGLALNVTGTLGEASVDAFRPRVRGLAAEGGRAIELPYAAGGDAAMLREFLAMARDRRPREPGLGVALRTLAIVLSAAESAGSGRTVPVRDLD
jgi:predicted dehydrogenase